MMYHREPHSKTAVALRLEVERGSSDARVDRNNASPTVHAVGRRAFFLSDFIDEFLLSAIVAA